MLRFAPVYREGEVAEPLSYRFRDCETRRARADARLASGAEARAKSASARRRVPARQSADSRERRAMRIEVPGLFDLQVNGFGGIDFNAADLTADRVDEALQQMLATGVTRCLPTLITSSFEQFAASARVLSRMRCAAVAGIHMEGPYLSPEDGARGAHPREHVRGA